MKDKSLDLYIDSLHVGWDMYLLNGTHEEFIDVAGQLSGLTEHINRLKLPGLARECAELEKEFLSRLGAKKDHPIGKETARTLNRKLESLLSIIMLARNQDPATKKRDTDPTQTVDWVRPRSIWIVAPKKSSWARGLAEQLSFYGFRVHTVGWGMALPEAENPYAVIFLPASNSETADIVSRVALEQVARVRKRCPISQLFYVGVAHSLDSVVTLMRAGIDISVQSDDQMATLLSRILDLVQIREQERYRILIVEDSKVAITQIRKALTNQGLDTRSLSGPTNLLEVMDEYQPDLVLMDMYMPTCNGVEATRVLRQMPKYQTTPIVFLSGETNVGLQIEALRLGGDYFMTKPFNPILLAATLKTTIERSHETRRASRYDGLTGLLNHTAAKIELKAWGAAKATGICVAMIDIDHFRLINDTHGPLVGDQVIRSLGWLLKGRLRLTDIVARHGGDEFIVAARDTAIEEMFSVLDRVRDSFAILPHAHTTGAFFATFSAGLAAHADHSSTTQAITAAGEALLRAKQEGRNRLLMAKKKRAIRNL